MKEKIKEMFDNKMFLIGLTLGALVVMVIIVIVAHTPFPLLLSETTGDEICQKLTGNNYSVTSDSMAGKLICKIPSNHSNYSSSNIIIKRAEESP